MGVPKFFVWMAERYPCIIQYLSESTIPSIDNLYLDVNGIIHACIHSNNSNVLKLPESEIFLKIFAYIDKLFALINPKQYFVLCVDGVAPRAKMNQQRSRRFRSARDTKEEMELLAQEGRHVPTYSEIFDRNAITPGTIFMDNLDRQLQFYLKMKQQTDLSWQKCRVVYSGHNVPGEGEHKIMEFIRGRKSEKNYKPDETHCLYGLDADLIMLSLASHEPHFILLREELIFKQENQKNTEIFQLIHINLLREYFALDLANDVRPNYKDSSHTEDISSEGNSEGRSNSINLERFIDDFILFCFFVGNDFLPHSPTLEIKEGALNLMLKSYKAMFRDSSNGGGYLTEMGKINWKRVSHFFKELAVEEERILESRKRQAKRNASKGWNTKEMDGGETVGNDVSNGVHPSSIVNDNNNYYYNKPITETMNSTKGVPLKSIKKVAMVTDDDEQEEEEVEAKNMNDLIKKEQHLYQEDLESGVLVKNLELADLSEVDEEEVDEELEFLEQFSDDYHSFRKQYYKLKMNIDISNQKEVDTLVFHYTEGLQWIYSYYFAGCPSWSWFYPYHYAPLASDLAGLAAFVEDLKFSLGKPFLPFQQLMAVLPAASAELVPPAYRPLMLKKSSPIAEFYPENFAVDRDGTKQKYEGVTLLPFIDEKLLLETLAKVDDQLTEDERRRNSFGQNLEFLFNPLKSYKLKSTFPGFFSDILHCSIDCRPFQIPDGSKFKPVLCKGVSLGTRGLEGFPTFSVLSVIPQDRKIDIKVFGFASRKSTLVLEVQNPGLFPHQPKKSKQEEKNVNNRKNVSVPVESSSVRTSMTYSNAALEGHQYHMQQRRQLYHHDNKREPPLDEMRSLIGEMVYVGYPYLQHGVISSISTLHQSIYSKEGKPSFHSKFDEDEFRNELRLHEQTLFNKFAIVLKNIQALVFVRLFKEMKKNIVTATYERVFHDKEFAYPLQFVFRSDVYRPIQDEKFVERKILRIDVEYPISKQVICLHPQYLGRLGEIVGYENSNSYLKVLLSATLAKPPYPPITKEKFFQFKAAANSIGISVGLLRLLTTKLQVLVDKQEFLISIPMRINNTLSVVGYARKEQLFVEKDDNYFMNKSISSNTKFSTTGAQSSYWMLSEKAVMLLSSYVSQFKTVFIKLEVHLERGDHIDSIPNLVRKVDIENMMTWLRQNLVEFNKAPQMDCDGDYLSADDIKALQQCPVSNRKVLYKEISVSLPFQSFYIPSAGDTYLQAMYSRKDFHLGDYVANLSQTGFIPFGLRGIIIGMNNLNAEVLFDDEFFGGITLDDKLSVKRGQTVAFKYLLNLNLNTSSVKTTHSHNAHVGWNISSWTSPVTGKFIATSTEEGSYSSGSKKTNKPTNLEYAKKESEDKKQERKKLNENAVSSVKIEEMLLKNQQNFATANGVEGPKKQSPLRHNETKRNDVIIMNNTSGVEKSLLTSHSSAADGNLVSKGSDDVNPDVKRLLFGLSSINDHSNSPSSLMNIKNNEVHDVSSIEKEIMAAGPSISSNKNDNNDFASLSKSSYAVKEKKQQLDLLSQKSQHLSTFKGKRQGDFSGGPNSSSSPLVVEIVKSPSHAHVQQHRRQQNVQSSKKSSISKKIVYKPVETTTSSFKSESDLETNGSNDRKTSEQKPESATLLPIKALQSKK